MKKRLGNTANTKGQRGASMIEYALLIALISFVGVVATQGVGIKVSQSIRNAADDINTAGGNLCTGFGC
jgi:Flp pilus assembly pilin Flp